MTDTAGHVKRGTGHAQCPVCEPGGAGTAFGGQISPLFIQKTPNPWQTRSYKGCGVQTEPVWVPILLKDTEGCLCSPQKAIVIQGWVLEVGFLPVSMGSAVRGKLAGAVFQKLPSLSLPDTFQRYLFHFKRKNVLSASPRGDNQPGDG